MCRAHIALPSMAARLMRARPTPQTPRPTRVGLMALNRAASYTAVPRASARQGFIGRRASMIVVPRAPSLVRSYEVFRVPFRRDWPWECERARLSRRSGLAVVHNLQRGSTWQTSSGSASPLGIRVVVGGSDAMVPCWVRPTEGLLGIGLRTSRGLGFVRCLSRYTNPLPGEGFLTKPLVVRLREAVGAYVRIREFSQ